MNMAHKLSFVYVFIILQGISRSIFIADSVITHTNRYCQHTGPHSVHCTGGKFINVTYAMYGRLSSSYCVTSTSVTNCVSQKSMQVVSRLCHAVNQCNVQASNAQFDDPCVGILKYLEISYTCLEGSREYSKSRFLSDNYSSSENFRAIRGSEFPPIQDIPDGYVYASQTPYSPVLHLQPNSTNLREVPFRFSIYNITETSYNPQLNETAFASAVDFLSTQLKVAAPTNSVCLPQYGNYASQFCIFPEYGYIFTANVFIPGLNQNKSYDIDIVVRDNSPIPFAGRARVRISVVPTCFPLQHLYDRMRSSCPSDISLFSFPTGVTWSNSHRKLFPISITAPITISRIFINTNLLVNFKRDNSYWIYEISFKVSGTTFTRNFTYVPSTLGFQVGQVIQTRGTEFNITIEPPIEVALGENSISISLKLLNYNGGTDIEFNNENALMLFGTQKITKCPDSLCMNAYKPWLMAVEKLKYSQNFQCISDESLQEVYLKPCNNDSCSRTIYVSLKTEGGAIIYHFQNEGTFKRFSPTFYRVIYYEYDGQSFPGYSEKYFCAPAPFDGAQRFICLNRYRGRFRVRQGTAADFRYLLEGSVFKIEIQAEATVGGIFMYDRCIFNLQLYLPSTTQVPLSIQSSTVASMLSSLPPMSITLSSPGISLATESSLSAISSFVRSSQITTLKPTPTMTVSTTPNEPTYNESLTVIVSKDPALASPINITCLRSTTQISIIRWYKDGDQLLQTGTSLILDAPTVNDQGYYQCYTQISGIKFFSNTKLIAFKDVFTSSVYLPILNRVFTTSLTDVSSTEFKTLSEEIIKATRNAIMSLPTNGVHDIKMEKFSKGSVVSQIKIASPIGTGHSMASYYSSMTSLLAKAANENNFGGFQINSAEIIIVNKERCLSQTTNTDTSKGPYTWPAVKSGDIATVPCASGPSGTNATRKCLGDFNLGAFWGSVSDSGCNFNSRVTSELKSLSEVVINSTNAESVASNLGDLTTNASSLTVDDALLASTTFQKLAASDITSEKVVNDMLQIASNLLQTNESVLASSQAKGNALSSIVKGIENIADSVQLPNKTGEAVVKISSGVAIQAMKLGTSSTKDFNFALKTSSILPGSIVANEAFDSNRVEIGLQLPATLLSDITLVGERRLSFVVYGGNQFFQTTKRNVFGRRVIDTSSKPNSIVISAHVTGAGKVSLSRPLQGTFKRIISSSSSDSCVFWNFTMNDGFGGWSSQGCRKVETSAERVICQCDHMTNFAIIFDPYAGTSKVKSETHEKILGIISFIGIGLSLGGLFLTLLTLLLFRRLRRTLPPKILIHLCLSLMLTLISFVAGADRIESLYVCRAFAVAIHYFMLVTFLWMTVEAFNLYSSFVIVMGSYISRFMFKAAAYAWGIPVVIVAVTASLKISDYGNDRYCIVSNWAAYGSLFIPICIVIFLNFVVLIRVFYALRSSANGKKVTKEQRRSGISQLRIAATFSCILGLSWVFGIFAVGDGRLAFQYLFCIFNSLQGFTIFVLHVARHQDARNHWIYLLTGKGLNYHRASMTSTSHRPYRPNKSNSSEDYRMRTPSSEQDSGTLTSTLGRTSFKNSADYGTSFA